MLKKTSYTIRSDFSHRYQIEWNWV